VHRLTWARAPPAAISSRGVDLLIAAKEKPHSDTSKMVSAYRLRPGVDVLLLLGTDGLFEFCNNTSAAGQLLKDGLSVSALEELCQQSRERWTKSSFNETVDDITAIAAVLPAENLHRP